MKTQDIHKNTYIQDTHTHTHTKREGIAKLLKLKAKKKTRGFERSKWLTLQQKFGIQKAIEYIFKVLRKIIVNLEFCAAWCKISLKHKDKDTFRQQTEKFTYQKTWIKRNTKGRCSISMKIPYYKFRTARRNKTNAKGKYTATATAKSLQSCPTLCDPIDGSPPGSPVPGILQASTLEWVAISFCRAWKWKVKSLSHVRASATPWTAAYQAPPPMGFSRQEYWSGVPLPSPLNILVSMKLYPLLKITVTK